jgi:hypothetical protein
VGNNFWVNPEELERTGRPYHERAEYYERLSADIQSIVQRYSGCWGKDELGRKIDPVFVDGLDAIGDTVRTLGQQLRYGGDELRKTGGEFRKSEEDAQEYGQMLLGESPVRMVPLRPTRMAPDDPGGDPQMKARMVPLRPSSSRIPNVSDGDSQMKARMVPLRPSSSRIPDVSDGDSQMKARMVPLRPSSSRIPDVSDGDSQMKARMVPLQPASISVPADDSSQEEECVPRQPTNEWSALGDALPGEKSTPQPGSVEEEREPRGVLTSATVVGSALNRDVPPTVDGVPVDDRYEVMRAHETNDGNVRLDLKDFDRVIPLGPDRVVEQGGQAISAGDGEQLFLVERKPDGSPAGDHQYWDFSRDGSAAPHQPSATGHFPEGHTQPHTPLHAEQPVPQAPLQPDGSDHAGPGDRHTIGDDHYGVVSSRLHSNAKIGADGQMVPTSVDGIPLDNGLSIMTAKELADGKVRLDVNNFDFLTPVGPNRTVLQGGVPLVPDHGEQLFIVRGRHAPDGQHAYWEFSRDGSANLLSRPRSPNTQD